MKISNNIVLSNFKKKLSKEKIKKNLNFLLKNKNEILKSCSPSYKYKYSNKFLKKIKKKIVKFESDWNGGVNFRS